MANHRMEELLAVLDEVWVLSRGVISRKFTLDDLRRNAVRVTGKLKPAAAAPAGLSFVEEMRTGDVVRWLIIRQRRGGKDPGDVDPRSQECEPLAPETAFKLLQGEKNY